MSLFDKHKVVDAARNRSGHPLGGFFWRVEEIVLDDDVTSAPDKLEEAVSQMVAVVAEKASNEELQALHLLTSELSRQMERLVQKTAFQKYVTLDYRRLHRAARARTLALRAKSKMERTPNSSQIDQAHREDEAAEQFLKQQVESKAPPIQSTPESIQRGQAMLKAVEETRNQTVRTRIQNKELLTSGELQLARDVNRQSISGAVKSNRLFAFVGPSGKNFYPAYFADKTLDLRKLEAVSKALGTLPAPSKHHFFTSTWSTLGTTPLEALRAGRLADVLETAAGFVEQR